MKRTDNNQGHGIRKFFPVTFVQVSFAIVKIAIVSVLFICIVLLLPAGISQARDVEKVQPANPVALPSTSLKTIIVDNYYPYTFVNDKGIPDGFSVEIAKAVASVMDFKLIISVDTWEHATKALEDGIIDLLPMMAYSPERDKVFDFSAPHTIAYDAVFLRNGAQRISSLEDLVGKTVIVMNKDAAHQYFLSSGMAAKMKLILVDSLPDALRTLAEGKGDAALMPKLVGLITMKKLNLMNLDSSLVVIDAYNRPFCFAVKDENQALLERLSQGLSIIKATGQYQEIYKKWFGALEPPGLSRVTVVKYIAGIVAVSLLIGLGLIIWNVSLRNQVALRTEKLEAEIQERKQAEEALRENEEKYRNLFENANEAIFVVQDGKLVFLNPMTTMITGYLGEELMTRPFIEYIHPDDRDMVFDRHVRRMKGEELPHLYSFRIIHKDSKIRWVELNAVLIKWSGKAATLNFLTDITERKQSEEELKKQLNLFERITETSPIGITLVDSDGSIRFANLSAEKILGLTKDEITGRVYNDPRWHIVDESGGPFPEDKLPFFRVMKTGAAVHNVRHGIKWPGGRSVILSINAAPLKDDSDKVIGMVAALQDITEHKRMEEELLKADKLESVGILAGGIAHDFNNILTSISGNISMAKMLVKPGNKISDLLGAAETASVRAQGLTRQLLTFAKGGTPVKETVFLKKLIKESSLFVLRGSKSGCEFQIAEDLWPVEADLGQIGQVISNIVINADQAMPEGGTIRITAENLTPEKMHEIPVDPGRYIRISIKDQGVGIAEKHLSKIFDPYFTTKQAGSGLGLATAYSIIKKHNGYISVNSIPGAGTTFHIYLPASDKEIPVKEEVAMLTGSGRILMMDDDELLKELAKEMLDMLGYESAFAKDGAEAIEMYRKAMESEKPYDAVILDLTIPGSMGGKEVIKILLKIDPEVKAIVFSGYSESEVMSNYHEYGFKGMMPKPFDSYALGKVLNEVLTTGKSMKET